MPRNGRIVVVVVLAIALSVGALGSWWMVRSRPEPGAFIDVVALPDGGAVIVRHERGTDHAFVEVRGPDRLRWRGLIPRYAGAPGTLAVAASRSVVTVRVVRGDHPHLFAFDTQSGDKIASFDLADGEPPDPRAYTLPELATVTAGERSVEVLARPGGGARLILVELQQHRLAWRVDLATPPDAVWFAGDAVVARAGGVTSAWAAATGEPIAPPAGAPPITTAAHPVPAGAVPARAYHRDGDRIWIVTPAALTVLDGALRPVATINE